jgi:hypothetical protein
MRKINLFIILLSVFLVISQFKSVSATGIIRIQGNKRAISTTNYLSLTLDSAPIDGNVLIATFSVVCDAVHIETVSAMSETGVNWSRVTGFSYVWTAAYTGNVEIWMGIATPGAGAGIGINLAGGATTIYESTVNVCEYQGLVTIDTIDRTNVAYDDGIVGTVQTTNVTTTTTQNSELWLGAETVIGGVAPTSPTNGFIMLDGVLTNAVSNAYLEKIVALNGTAGTGTITVSDSHFVGCIATFKTSGATPPPSGGSGISFNLNIDVDYYLFGGGRYIGLIMVVIALFLINWLNRYSFIITVTLAFLITILYLRQSPPLVWEGMITALEAIILLLMGALRLKK